MNKLLSLIFVVVAVLLPITGLASVLPKPASKPEIKIDIDPEAASRMGTMHIRVEAQTMYFDYDLDKSFALDSDGVVRIKIALEFTNAISGRKAFWLVMKIFHSNNEVDTYDVYPWGAELRQPKDK